MTRSCQSKTQHGNPPNSSKARRKSIIREPRTDSRPRIRIESTPICWRFSRRFTKSPKRLDATEDAPADRRCRGRILPLLLLHTSSAHRDTVETGEADENQCRRDGHCPYDDQCGIESKDR